MGARGASIIAALAALAALALAGPAAAACKLVKIAELPVTMNDLLPVIPAQINGKDARLIADSGAFFSLVTPAAAARFGLRMGGLPFGVSVRGVTGEAQAQSGNAKDLTVLGYPFHNVDFLVGSPQLAYENVDGLLGQNLLNISDMEFDLANGVIRLFRPEGCENAMLAYWDQGGAASMVPLRKQDEGRRELDATASVNGQEIAVIFDTGSPRSMLTLKAARRAGVKTDDPGVVAAGVTGGLGRGATPTWIAPFKSFKIGGEEVQNTHLRIGALQLNEFDMLLGADFFLSHRIYVARGQRKLYFTYNGGPVFHLDRATDAYAGAALPDVAPPAPGAGAAAVAPPSGPAAAAGPPGAPSDEPKDAAGYARRGAASAARRDFVRALADFDRAVALTPKDADLYVRRAHINEQAGRRAAALADLDQAIKLKPDDAQMLLRRGGLRMHERIADLAKAGGGKPADKARDDAIRADFEAAVRLDPTQRGDVASVYAMGGMFEPAIAQYDVWIASGLKGDALGFALNARCWARALWGHELDKALTDCDAAIGLEPRIAGFLDSRGLVHLRRGELDPAIADYDAALHRQPGIAWSLYGRGLARLKKGMKAEGDADIAAAEKAQPGIADEARGYGVTP